jgi:hypothetical protein
MQQQHRDRKKKSCPQYVTEIWMGSYFAAVGWCCVITNKSEIKSTNSEVNAHRNGAYLTHAMPNHAHMATEAHGKTPKYAHFFRVFRVIPWLFITLGA